MCLYIECVHSEFENKIESHVYVGTCGQVDKEAWTCDRQVAEHRDLSPFNSKYVIPIHYCCWNHLLIVQLHGR